MTRFFNLTYSTRVKYFVIISFALLISFASNAQTENNESVKLSSFEGFYQLQASKDLYLQLKAEGKKLRLIQLWDDKEKILIQTSELIFEDQTKFKLTFSKNASDSITSMLANDRDIWIKDSTYQPEIVEELNATQIKALKVL